MMVIISQLFKIFIIVLKQRKCTLDKRVTNSLCYKTRLDTNFSSSKFVPAYSHVSSSSFFHDLLESGHKKNWVLERFWRRYDSSWLNCFHWFEYRLGHGRQWRAGAVGWTSKWAHHINKLNDLRNKEIEVLKVEDSPEDEEATSALIKDMFCTRIEA